MGQNKRALDKFMALYRQFIAHLKKFQAGVKSEDFYKSKKALSDMVSFHNEMVKIRDRLERKRDTAAVEALDEQLENTREHLLDEFLETFELSHKEVL